MQIYNYLVEEIFKSNCEKSNTPDEIPILLSRIVLGK